jgi:hypothetical protein
MSRNALLKSARLIHLYFGVFITPALIFFAFTGAIQTFGLHETNRDHPTYVPAKWLVVLGQIHKKQTPVVNPRRPQPQAEGLSGGGHARRPDAAAPTAIPTDPAAPAEHRRHSADFGNSDSKPAQTAQATPAATPDAPKPTPAPSKHHPLPLRIFFLIVAIGLFTSTLTGLYMSYKYVRNKVAVTLTLVAGLILPILLTLV